AFAVRPGAGRSVERHPGHHLGMDELSWLAAYLPDSFIGTAPDFFQMLEKNLADFGPARRGRQSGPARQAQHVGQFAENVELKLLGGGVSNPDRTGILVAWQMRKLEFI